MRILIALLLAISCFGQTIRTSGSRMDRTDAEWAVVAGKKTGTAAEQAQWAIFTGYLTTFCSSPTTLAVNSGNLICMEAYALAYKLDPTNYGTDYATKGCALLKYYVDMNDGDNGGYIDTDAELVNGDSFRWGAPVASSTWALLRDHCDSVDPTVGEAFRFTAARAWDILKPDAANQNNKFAILKTPYQVNGNVGVGQVNGMVRMAIAAYEPGTFTAPQTTWIPTMVSTMIEQYIVPCLLASTAASSTETCYGGSWGEGMSEYGPETVQLTMDLFEAFRIGTTDTDYWPSLEGVFPELVANWTLAGTSPTGPQGPYYKLYQPYLYRDVQAGNGQYYGYYWIYWRYAVLRMRDHLARIGDTTRADSLQWWLKNIMPVFYLNNPPASQMRSFYHNFLLFEDPESTGVDYRTSATSLDDMTPFMLLSRSDWTDNATWVGIQAMQEGGSHQHGDSGAFNIWRKGKWLTREMPGYFNPVSNAGSSHNTLTVNGHGPHAGYHSANLTGIARVQRRTGGWMSTCNDTYCATEMDLSPAFKFSGYLLQPDVDTITRDFFYLKPDIFIVADRIKYATYASAVTASSIFHVQSEKGAALISGDRATISNASQRLYVTKLYPSTADFFTPLQTTAKIIDVHLRTNDQAAFFVDRPAAPAGTYTVSGFTGAYAVINGSRTFTLQASATTSGYEPFQDNMQNTDRLILTSSGLFAGLPEYDPEQHGYGNTTLAKATQWNDPDINPLSPGTLVTHNPYRLDIHSGHKVNEDAFLVAMQGADSTDTPLDFTALTSTTSNMTGTSFTPPGGSLIEIMAPTLTTPTFPMCITRSGDPATHYVLGLTAGTTYKVSDSTGVTCVDTTGAGTSVIANNAGIITYHVDTSVQSPQITLVATPSSISASCPAGGASPGNQTTVITATGDSGEAAITAAESPDVGWLSVALSGGAAPQNTPQTVTASFYCSGLAAGTYETDIAITSGTAYVTNSGMTVHVTLTVTPAEVIGAIPSSVNFTATVSGGNPADQTVAVSRTAPGDFTFSSDQSWLTVTPSSATSTSNQSLNLAVDIAGLSAGNHNATITITSSGATNSPFYVPVLLALNNPIQIGLEPEVADTAIRVRYIAQSRAACTVRMCTDASCDTEIVSESDGGGFRRRVHILNGLTASTTQTLQVNCEGTILARTITTTSGAGAAVNIPLNLDNRFAADNILVNYGASPGSLGSSTTGTCSTRCTATLPATRGVFRYYQVVYRDAMNATIHTGPVEAALEQ